MGLRESYRAQYGQDRLVLEVFFPFKVGGMFFECGALDGILFSNTFVFEKERQWHGILIEPLVDQYQMLVGNRPLSRCFNICLGPKEEEVLFLQLSGCSGIIREVGREHIMRIEREFRHRKDEVTLSWMPVRNLTSVFDECDVSHVDYFSLDVEGGEEFVLSGLDLDKITIDVVTVEINNHSFGEVYSRFKSKGYVEFGRLGQDAIFVRKPFLEKALVAHDFEARIDSINIEGFSLISGWQNV